MKNFRNLVLEFVNALFDELERGEATTELDTESNYGFEFLDDEDDSYSSYEDDRAISASDCDFWPKLTPVSAQGSGAKTKQAPTIEWPNTAPAKHAASFAGLAQTVETDGRGRACVPASLTSLCGFKPQDFVYVSVRAHNQPGLVLLKNPSQTGHLSTYTVDKDGNIRLSHFVLTQGNLGAASKVRFKADKQKIVVLQG